MSSGRTQDVNFKHNTVHITDAFVLFLVLPTKCMREIDYIFGETSCRRPQNVPKRRPYDEVLGTSPISQF